MSNKKGQEAHDARSTGEHDNIEKVHVVRWHDGGDVKYTCGLLYMSSPHSWARWL